MNEFEVIDITEEELEVFNTLRISRESIQEFLLDTMSNLSNEDYECFLDESLSKIKFMKLEERKFLDFIKDKYKLSDMYFCEKEDKLYGRIY